jgi:hypothetical protein
MQRGNSPYNFKNKNLLSVSHFFARGNMRVLEPQDDGRVPVDSGYDGITRNA